MLRKLGFGGFSGLRIQKRVEGGPIQREPLPFDRPLYLAIIIDQLCL